MAHQSLPPDEPRNERPAPVWISKGTPAYRRAELALFLAGFASFSLLYCVQPLLPAFAATFNVTPAASSLALSLTTGMLAVSILLGGAYSQVLGRRGLMFASMMLGALLNIVAAVMPDWHGLLIARALEGLVLGGVPAVAMAWLAEEIEPAHLGRTMGLYVAGTAFGGMAGRVGMGALTEFVSWRIALVALGVLCLACAVGFILLLPRSRNFTPTRNLDPAFHLRAWGGHLWNRGLLRLYFIGFLLMSVFVTVFNYATFLLSEPPYELSQTQVSLIFLAYGFGIVSSGITGSLMVHFGARGVIACGFTLMLAGTLLTLSVPLIGIIAGISVMTTGFFIGHAAASSSVGRLATVYKGHAASLYLLFYYVGSSIVGSAGGWFWEHGGWSAIVALTGGMSLAGAALALAFRPRTQA
ncbi:MFS transporter [Pseudochelatococcus contaminans]|uniref:YNFM family putative membrane transporter n=1 Tax=Pseudochelatococcus contaminans TaxID=1538103 RepID=A0A7W5Z4N1_9HYPH|nr:MFS transporter [Pseudochelatococcus contaminans]MBB3810012.1 YNFM family putative membrane transporter [Pseudochelatococcus contaminans]